VCSQFIAFALQVQAEEPGVRAGAVKKRSAKVAGKVNRWQAATRFCQELTRLQPDSGDAMSLSWETEFPESVRERALKNVVRNIRSHLPTLQPSQIRPIVREAHAALLRGDMAEPRSRRGPLPTMSDADLAALLDDLQDGYEQEEQVPHGKHLIWLMVRRYYTSLPDWIMRSAVVKDFVDQHHIEPATIIRQLQRKYGPLSKFMRSCKYKVPLSARHRESRQQYCREGLRQWRLSDKYGQLLVQLDEKKVWVSTELSKGQRVYARQAVPDTSHPNIVKCGGGLAVNYIAATSYMWGPVLWEPIAGTTDPTKSCPYKVRHIDLQSILWQRMLAIHPCAGLSVTI
jgi:hypothetical protein